jgi:hypothetical protein
MPSFWMLSPVYAVNKMRKNIIGLSQLYMDSVNILSLDKVSFRKGKIM